MASGIVRMSAFAGGSAVISHCIINGEVANALLVPALGYALRDLGNYLKSSSTSKVGNAIFFGAVLIAPGTTVGYGIYALGGKTLAATAAGILGAFLTHKKTTSLILNFSNQKSGL